MGKSSPLMEQYFNIKSQCKDAVLLFRMGDFYETFGDDAVTTSRVLNITLTSRQKDDEGQKIPLAGIPYHALEAYLGKLVSAGYNVAICEQVEDPKKAKGLVKREITRVVTPGTIIESYLLNDSSNNYLASLIIKDESAGLAFIDVSTGEFLATEVSKNRVHTELAKFRPSECLLPVDMEQIEIPVQSIQRLDASAFDLCLAKEAIEERFGVLDWPDDRPLAAMAAGAILSYLSATHLDSHGHIASIQLYSPSDFMILDEVTLKNLEIFRNIRDGSKKDTLLEFLDRTQTAIGSRCLSNWLKMPSLSVSVIRLRQDAVEELACGPLMREGISGLLKGLSDMERLMGRISYQTATPKDLQALKTSLERLPGLVRSLETATSSYLVDLRDRLNPGTLTELVSKIDSAIVDDPPTSIRDGGLIRGGYDPELDALKSALTDGKGWIARLEAEERQKTGIKSLKVGFNNVFGYYIEVTKPNLSQVPSYYQRKQTLANAERFVTEELSDMESKVLSAQERSVALEQELFLKLRNDIADSAEEVSRKSVAVAELDVLVSLAVVAIDCCMVRPEINVDGSIIIRDSKHPVLDKALRGSFVPNDVKLDTDENRFMILTGPNMAGKSTFMRQIALIVIMAQVGSFVPAAFASLGLVDSIFTRVGARDDLAVGQSTFMVEMTELAHILTSATPNSLILLDEIGRGTSTFDGLSIAWAVTEYINSQVKAKTIFATHYHQITQLGRLPGIVNFNMAVIEDKGDITFLRTVVPGATDKSYGIHVARLAGVPMPVIQRAKDVLKEIEGQAVIELDKSSKQKKPRYTQLIFFPSNSSSQPQTDEPQNPVLNEIDALDIDSMTPLEALNSLAKIKREVEQGKIRSRNRSNRHIDAGDGSDDGDERRN